MLLDALAASLVDSDTGNANTVQLLVSISLFLDQRTSEHHI